MGGERREGGWRGSNGCHVESTRCMFSLAPPNQGRLLNRSADVNTAELESVNIYPDLCVFLVVVGGGRRNGGKGMGEGMGGRRRRSRRRRRRRRRSWSVCRGKGKGAIRREPPGSMEEGKEEEE